MPAASMLVQRRVEWSDTDASGIHHNTFIVRLAEAAEHALWRRVFLDEERGNLVPRVRIEVDFLKPLRAGDLVEGEISVAEMGRSSITFAFEARDAGVVVARAKIVGALVSGETWRPMEWPADARERILTAGSLRPELLSD
ncbi:MAG: acyl-CoA thioesterase [Actinomycetota bacterium]